MASRGRGRASSEGGGGDYINVHRDFDPLDFDPRKHDSSHFLKALESFRSKLNKLGARERRIIDDKLLGEAAGTLIRAFGMGIYRPSDSGSFNNFLHELALDLIKAKNHRRLRRATR